MECQQAGIVAEGQHSKYSDYQRGSGIVSKQGGGGLKLALERGGRGRGEGGRIKKTQNTEGGGGKRRKGGGGGLTLALQSEG